MNPGIASLHERMSQGGDCMTSREEIARLHKEAKTQEEYVTVLEAHRNLVAVAEHCFPPEQYAQIRQIAQGEYKMFLNVEAMEGDMINPIILDKITAREVAAGRLEPGDDFRKLAEAGALLGDSADSHYDRKLGDRVGIAGAVLGVIAFFAVSKVVGVILFVVGMGSAWFINETRKKRALAGAQLDRVARGYE